MSTYLHRVSYRLSEVELSTPLMELNPAVLSKQGRQVIEKEMRFKFEGVLRVVEPETVLR